MDPSLISAKGVSNLKGRCPRYFSEKSFIFFKLRDSIIYIMGFERHFNKNYEDHEQGQIMIFSPSHLYT